MGVVAVAMLLLTRNWSSMFGWLLKMKLPSGLRCWSTRPAHNGPRQVPEPRVVGVEHPPLLPRGHRVDDQRGVERLVAEVAHRQHWRGGSVHLEGALVEVAQGLSRDVAVPGGLELAVAQRPVAAAPERARSSRDAAGSCVWREKAGNSGVTGYRCCITGIAS